jgi:hypothetical protein
MPRWHLLVQCGNALAALAPLSLAILGHYIGIGTFRQQQFRLPTLPAVTAVSVGLQICG